MAKPTVLFICTGNASRSQLARAMTEQLSDGKILAAGAGTFPGKAINPGSVAVMKERGVDVSDQHPRSLYDCEDSYDRMITLCDNALRYCVELKANRPAQLLPPVLAMIPDKHEHWSIPDPGFNMPAHWKVAEMLEPRIRELVARLTGVAEGA